MKRLEQPCRQFTSGLTITSRRPFLWDSWEKRDKLQWTEHLLSLQHKCFNLFNSEKYVNRYGCDERWSFICHRNLVFSCFRFCIPVTSRLKRIAYGNWVFLSNFKAVSAEHCDKSPSCSSATTWIIAWGARWYESRTAHTSPQEKRFKAFNSMFFFSMKAFKVAMTCSLPRPGRT